MIGRRHSNTTPTTLRVKANTDHKSWPPAQPEEYYIVASEFKMHGLLHTEACKPYEANFDYEFLQSHTLMYDQKQTIAKAPNSAPRNMSIG